MRSPRRWSAVLAVAVGILAAHADGRTVAVRTVAPPECLARHGVPATPEDLAHHQVIGVRAAPGILPSAINRSI